MTGCDFVFDLEHLQPSKEVEQQVRAEAAVVERRFGPMRKCRVWFDARDCRGFPFHIHHVRAIGEFYHRAGQFVGEGSHADLMVAMQSAFASMRNELTETEAFYRSETESCSSGHIVEVRPQEGQAFMLSEAGERLTCRKTRGNPGIFERLHVGDRVWFVQEAGGDTHNATIVHVIACHPAC